VQCRPCWPQKQKNRRQNFADEKIQGLDYNLEYRMRGTTGQWTFGLAGTHVMKFEQSVPGWRTRSSC
jgi:hypothetical protein